MNTPVQLHIASKCTKLPSYQIDSLTLPSVLVYLDTFFFLYILPGARFRALSAGVHCTLRVFMQNTLTWSQNCLTHGKNSVIMNLFSIENVYLFPDVTVSVVKRIFCYKEEILMETDPFLAYLCRILNILL